MKFASYVKSVLLELIDYYEKNPASYVKNPNKDFVRNRKLNLSSTIKLIMSLNHLLTEIPNHMDDTDRSFLKDLLPWSENLPKECYK